MNIVSQPCKDLGVSSVRTHTEIKLKEITALIESFIKKCHV